MKAAFYLGLVGLCAGTISLALICSGCGKAIPSVTLNTQNHIEKPAPGLYRKMGGILDEQRQAVD
jgi:hypothetical protein